MSKFINFTPAVEKDDYEEFKKQFKNIDIKDTDDFGYTAVMICAYFGRDRMLKYVLKHGGKKIINQTKDNNNALDLAIEKMNKSTAQILIENGIDVLYRHEKRMDELSWYDLISKEYFEILDNQKQ